MLGPAVPLQAKAQEARVAPGEGGDGSAKAAARHRLPAKAEAAATATVAAWSRLTANLLAAHAARHPELAFERGTQAAKPRGLGLSGTEAVLAWRAALVDAAVGFERLELAGAPGLAAAQMRVLTDWVEAQKLLLDAQALAISDPSSYVRRALSVLRAASEALWIEPEPRLEILATLLDELPAYFRDARISLAAPAPQSIDLALEDLDDLEELVRELEQKVPDRPRKRQAPRTGPARPAAKDGAASAGNASKPAAAKSSAGKPAAKAGPPKPGTAQLGAGKSAAKKPKGAPKKAPEHAPVLENSVKPPVADEDALGALDSFRGWLQEIRPAAGGRTPRLEGTEWARLVQLVSGTRSTPGEIKARCLRDLVRVERPADESTEHRRAVDPEGAAQRAWTASARALQLGLEARVLRFRLAPKDIEFGVEESLRTDVELARVRPAAKDPLSVELQLSSPSWPVERTRTRQADLRAHEPLALGVRHGLAGEALLERVVRDAHNPLIALLENRAVREGIGLFALDWIGRIDWVENPFRAQPEALAEFAGQRAYEAARLLAALELHAEGVSVAEAVESFRRRTRVDEDTAEAEVLAAQRDPLHGIGWLGLEELCALEQRLSAATDPRKGLSLTLLLTFKHPELRPADLAAAAGGLRRPR